MSEELDNAIEYLKWSGKPKLANAVAATAEYKEIAENLGASNQKLSAACAALAADYAALKEENESLKSALSRACNFQLIAENESVALMKDIDRLKNGESLALADLHNARQRAGQLEHELLALKAMVAELEFALKSITDQFDIYCEDGGSCLTDAILAAEKIKKGPSNEA